MTITKQREAGHIDLSFSFGPAPPLEDWLRSRLSAVDLYNLRLLGEKISLQEGFDELICLDTLQGVELFWYQIETAKRVLRHFRGRVLLADEVGLGKTIEAGILLKEYLLRGLVERVLILTPPALVSQWREELETKFSLEFVTTEGGAYRGDPQRFWQDHPRIIASLNVAKAPNHLEILQTLSYDLVIIDEAHHVKNRATRNYQLANSLKSKFIFLLTATPVQNDLMELYQLVTLLRPGTFKTPSAFRRQFMTRGDPFSPQNRERLRELLAEVMIRNTRSLADVRLPRRYASTLIVEPEEGERNLYQAIGALVKEHYREEHGLDRFTANTLLMEAGSTPAAIRATLERLLSHRSVPKGLERSLRHCRALAESLPPPRKARKLIELLKSQGDKKLVFTHFQESLHFLATLLAQEGIPFCLYHGGMSGAEKDDAVRRFREEVPVLLSTESGGEGRNLQFCNTLINFDLPWNPLQIEQRIGRIHRIGQTREVFIFNLANRFSLEEYILSVLDAKLNLFELVVGELDMILGNLNDERDFPDIVVDLWIRSAGDTELREEFDRLGEELRRARERYLASKELDEQLFGEEFEA
jgi:SNF2 family DNA or RNA helicase